MRQRHTRDRMGNKMSRNTMSSSKREKMYETFNAEVSVDSDNFDGGNVPLNQFMTDRAANLRPTSLRLPSGLPCCHKNKSDYFSNSSILGNSSGGCDVK